MVDNAFGPVGKPARLFYMGSDRLAVMLHAGVRQTERLLMQLLRASQHNTREVPVMIHHALWFHHCFTGYLTNPELRLTASPWRNAGAPLIQPNVSKAEIIVIYHEAGSALQGASVLPQLSFLKADVEGRFCAWGDDCGSAVQTLEDRSNVGLQASVRSALDDDGEHRPCCQRFSSGIREVKDASEFRELQIVAHAPAALIWLGAKLRETQSRLETAKLRQAVSKSSLPKKKSWDGHYQMPSHDLLIR